MHKVLRRLGLNDRGVIAVEFAILLPLFIIFLLGIIECGIYFIKAEIVARIISIVVMTLQLNPNYYQGFTQPQLAQLVNSYGSGIIDFTNGQNFVCGNAYQTIQQAMADTSCTYKSSGINLSNLANPYPQGTTGAYYISIVIQLPKGTITPIGNFISSLENLQILQSSGPVLIMPLPALLR